MIEGRVGQTAVVHAAAGRVVAALGGLGAAPAGRVLVLDGMTGSGKSTLCAEILAAVPGARSLSVEDLVPGWEALARGVQRCGTVLEALSAGRGARVPTWDWQAMAPGPTRSIPPLDGGLLVVEGCGALAAAARDLPGLAVLRVLLEASAELRHARIAARDSYAWDVAAWEAQQRALAERWRGSARFGPTLRLPEPPEAQ